MLMAMAIPQHVAAQSNDVFDFTAVSPSGHTLYYKIIGNDVQVSGGLYSWYAGAPEAGDLIIPASVSNNGTTYNVTSIREWAFRYCQGLTSVTIPNSVTSIGSQAFSYCYNIAPVTIPNSVTTIENFAFSYVRHIEYYGTATGGPWGAFSMNDNGVKDENFVYSDNTRHCITAYIGHGGHVTVPSTVDSIGENAFSMCGDITTLTVPNSVTGIGNSAFGMLRHVEYYGTATGGPWGAITMNGVKDNNFVYSDNTRHKITAYIGAGGSVVIPSTVDTIGERAFQGCTTPMTVTIPNTVTGIEPFAFIGCYGLTSVSIPNSITKIENSTFYLCVNLSTITIPNSVTEIGVTAFFSCGSLDTVTIPNSVTKMSHSIFANCKNLRSVTIPSSVTRTGGPLFWDCRSMTSINCMSEVPPVVESSSLYGSAVVSLDIPIYVPCGSLAAYQAAEGFRGHTNIHEMAGCSGATDTTNIRTCTGQTLLFELNDGNHTAKVIGYVGSCTGSLTVPAWFSVDGERYEVTAIGANAFENCTGLESVILPRSITLVDTEAFKGCTALVTVDMK